MQQDTIIRTTATATSTPRARRGLARADLLVGLLVGVGLAGTVPVLAASVRPEAQRTQSLVNLRTLGTAHMTYAAEWNDRQWTLVDDNLAVYGTTADAAWKAYAAQGPAEADRVRGPILGFATRPAEGEDLLVRADNRLREPIIFDVARGQPLHAMGSFRLTNARTFNQYVNGRFYDQTFYAPDDHVAQARLRGATGAANVLVAEGDFAERRTADGDALPPVWSSYVRSPAGMLNPQVLAASRTGADGAVRGGFIDPYSVAGGFRSPAVGQTRYPALKTLMIEHDWLGAAASGANPAARGLREGEVPMPYRFNASIESEPATLWSDGHVSVLPVIDAWRADQRMRRQTGDMSGLWSRDTPFGADGYAGDLRRRESTTGGEPVATATSFHILTTDGCLGRDTLAP
jgi:hypothetical protein